MTNNEDFSSIYPTWIIAYSPDINSFFTTNQRHFYWEYDEEFQEESDAIEYFKSHLEEFGKIRNELLKSTGGWRTDSPLYLESTKGSFQYTN